MDPVSEIKAKLSIDDLVGQYCQLTKKGRDFVCLCPFHNDTHPSFVVSPEKGIAYCFACNSGGDIFSFYQKIEGVDFRQALKELGEKAGVDTSDMKATPKVSKDEKDRLRDCLTAAMSFYQKQLQDDKDTMQYLQDRHVSPELIQAWHIGKAPDSFSETYEYLLKQNFSRTEIVKAGLGVQKELSEQRIYDRFRNRVMIPIFDHQARIVGFGGRTLGDDDAKYINSSDGPLYHKSKVLFGIDKAKDAMRTHQAVVMVEGYFDVLACHRVGIEHVVAVSGTALTVEHVKYLKRTVDTVILCMDSDRAGRQAAQRAFELCTPEGLQVKAVALPAKDPDEAAEKHPEQLKQLLLEGARPYLDLVIEGFEKHHNLQSADGKRAALQRMLPLIDALPGTVERKHYVGQLAVALATTDAALEQDLRALRAPLPKHQKAANESPKQLCPFSSAELTLGLVLHYPQLRHQLSEMIEPQDGFAKTVLLAIKELSDDTALTPEVLSLSPEFQEKLSILLLYCEQNDLIHWSDSIASREIRSTCRQANRTHLQTRQRDIASKLLEAKREGDEQEQIALTAQYQEVLKLAKMAG